MNPWLETILFGLTALSFILGVSSFLMGATSPATGKEATKQKIEYNFFGVTGLVICALLSYNLV